MRCWALALCHWMFSRRGSTSGWRRRRQVRRVGRYTRKISRCTVLPSRYTKRRRLISAGLVLIRRRAAPRRVPDPGCLGEQRGELRVGKAAHVGDGPSNIGTGVGKCDHLRDAGAFLKQAWIFEACKAEIYEAVDRSLMFGV